MLTYPDKEGIMPTYEFYCQKCGKEFSRIMSIKERGNRENQVQPLRCRGGHPTAKHRHYQNLEEKLITAVRDQQSACSL